MTPFPPSSSLGVGVGMVMVSAIVCIYYNVIVAWTLYFLFMSFRAVLPWSTCDNEWNTENCVVGVEDTLNNPTTNSSLLASLNSTMYNSSMVNSILLNDTLGQSFNLSAFNGSLAALTNATAIITGKKISASEEFWT